MTFNALIVVCALLALLFIIGGVRASRRRRIGWSLTNFILALLLVLGVAGAVLGTQSLRTYQRLTAEQTAGELHFTRIGYHQFNGALIFPSGERADFELRGDEWQIDARIIKWQPFANLVGFDAVYRLDRISGRYTRIEDERTQPRTVFSLNTPDRLDLWELLHRYHAFIPGIDALYGSATYLPMEDGARYELKVSQSGLIARPLNSAASTAVGNWQ